MYCRKCGVRLAEGISFCTNCGERIAPLAVTVEEQKLQAEQSAPVSAAPENTETAQTVEKTEISEPDEAAKTAEAPAQNEIPQIPAYTAPVDQQAQTTILPPVITVEKREKVKTDFGKGALAFCLVIIGLLAVSTGVFAGLFFSLL